MIDWEQYSKKPTEATLSLYPSLLDVIKQEVEDEEKNNYTSILSIERILCFMILTKWVVILWCRMIYPNYLL